MDSLFTAIAFSRFIVTSFQWKLLNCMNPLSFLFVFDSQSFLQLNSELVTSLANPTPVQTQNFMAIERFDINFSSPLSASVEVHIDLLKKWQQHDAKRSTLPPFVCDVSRCLIKRILFCLLRPRLDLFFLRQARPFLHYSEQTPGIWYQNSNFKHKKCFQSTTQKSSFIRSCCVVFFQWTARWIKIDFFLYFSSRREIKISHRAMSERLPAPTTTAQKRVSLLLKNIYYLLFWAME